MLSSISIKEWRVVQESPFFKDLTDEGLTININGCNTQRGYWNLICSIREVGLYAKGIKTNRYWKITDVKKYYGLSVSATDILQKMIELRSLITQKD